MRLENSKVKELYIKGYNSEEIKNICKNNIHIDCSDIDIEDYININLNNLKKEHKVARQERIRELYSKGYNYLEISEIIKDNQHKIKSFVFRKCKELRISHVENRILKKELKRSIDIKNNSYISNVSFLKQNRQAYGYNKNLNLTFDEERSIDTPKTYYGR